MVIQKARERKNGDAVELIKKGGSGEKVEDDGGRKGREGRET